MSTNYDDCAGGNGRLDRARRKRIAARHHRAAKDGIHLPSTKELLLGSPWLGDDIDRDAQTWSERMLPKLDRGHEAGQKIAALFEQLTASPLSDDFWRARDAIMKLVQDRDVSPLGGIDPDTAVIRLEYYSACTGSRDACLAIAGRAIYLANVFDAPTDESAALLEVALGWLAAAPDARSQSRHRGRFSSSDSVRREAGKRGEMHTNEIIVAAAMLAADLEADTKHAEKVEPTENVEPTGRRVMRGVGTRPNAAMTTLEQYLEGTDEDEILTAKNSLVVIKEIGDPDTNEGKTIAKAYASVTNVRLPLTPKPDCLDRIQASLAAEFPHAADVIGRVLAQLEGADHVRFRQPIALIGSPGSGKTTLAGALLGQLGIRHQVYNCAGVSDSSAAGTPRQWSTGNPSLPVSLVRRHRTASPGIIFDEISRVAEGRKNGNLLDSILGFWEPESARRWFDPYLSAAVDLSHVVWLATCNDLEGMAPALRDRCIILRVPSPGPGHLEALGNRLLSRAIRDRGLPPAWAIRLDGTELQALAEVWKGGSLRALKRLIDGVLLARDVPSALA